MLHFIYCYAECRYAECRYAECRYAECLCAECRGAVNMVHDFIIFFQLQNMTSFFIGSTLFL